MQHTFDNLKRNVAWQRALDKLYVADPSQVNSALQRRCCEIYFLGIAFCSDKQNIENHSFMHLDASPGDYWDTYHVLETGKHWSMTGGE